MKLRQKYRLYPTPTQEQQMISSAGACRFVFNYFLQTNIEQYELDKTFIWHFDMNLLLTELKQEKTWLYDTAAQCLQQSTKDLDQALKNIKHGKEFPNFKSKYHTQMSFRYQQGVIIIDNRYVHLPNIGKVRIILDRPLPPFTGCTITEKAGQWYISFVIDKQEAPLVQDIEKIIGIDLNSEFTALSNGELIANPKPFKKNKKKIKKIQQNLSRKQKGTKTTKSSKGYIKTKRRLAKEHKKIADKRHYHLHQLSTRIAKEYDLVCVETLDISNMKNNHYAAKAIADCGWGMFISMLEYKCRLYGKHFVKINKWLPSSQTCSCCGNKQKVPLEVRTFDCESCDNEMHRDVNAAVNIANWGLQQWEIDNKKKSGTSLPGVPVDVIYDVLVNFDVISQTQMKLENVGSIN